MPRTKKFPEFDRPTLMIAPLEARGTERFPSDTPTAITLFSGVGSSSLAARDLGLEVLAHDFLPEACASLNANGFDVVQGDIRQVDFTHPTYRNVRLVVGGPPCQPFSPAGRNAGETDARDMIPDFLRCVAQTLPEVFIMEQTRGLAGPRHRDYLDRRLDEAEAIGYTVEHRILNAADYGIGQDRKRLFVIGVRDDIADERYDQAAGRESAVVRWPRKVRRTVTMAEALGWSREDCRIRNYLAPDAARDDVACMWPTQRPSTTVVGSFRPDVQAAPGYRQAGDGPRQNAPGSVVTTLRERLILQDMPGDWKVLGSKSKQDLQVGNSCPNGLLRALIEVNLGDWR